jgi:hypothetical protein
VARVAIRLKHDISPLIPLLGRTIEGCGTSAEPPGAAFRFDVYGVVINPDEITIFNTNDPAVAHCVVDLLKKIEADGDTMTKKVKTY